MPGESLFEALEPLLERVQKPLQYVGGELNSTVKDWHCGGFDADGHERTVRWALMYPDAYEVGLPNQGVMILYEVLGERPDTLAERTYAVWPDLEALLREARVPQLTVDAHRAVGDFDLLGVSFATELGYTNLLTALDLAGIPLHAADRADGHPLVVAGGHAAFNPEPIAAFVDAVVLGDGEQAVLAITDLVADWKAAGRSGGRAELLARLRPVRRGIRPGLLRRRVPPRRAHPAGRTAAGRDRHTVAGRQAHRDRPGLVALPQGTTRAACGIGPRADVGRDLPWLHPRLPVLPGRDGHPPGARAVDQRHRRDGGARSAWSATGFEEVGLLSLSSADHSEIAEITKGLADRYEARPAGLAACPPASTRSTSTWPMS